MLQFTGTDTIIRDNNRVMCMSIEPRGERRPADFFGCAVMVARIATGENTETLEPPSGKTRSGKAGAEARAKN